MIAVAELKQANGDAEICRIVESQQINAQLRASMPKDYNLARLVDACFAQVIDNPDPIFYETQPEIAEGAYVNSDIFQMESLSPNKNYKVCFLRRLSPQDYSVVIWDTVVPGDNCMQPIKADIFLSYSCSRFDEALLWYFKALEYVGRIDPKY